MKLKEWYLWLKTVSEAMLKCLVFHDRSMPPDSLAGVCCTHTECGHAVPTY